VGEKVVRFQAGTPTIEAGQMHLPPRAPWLDTFKREVLSFPASKNDDQVDAFSQRAGRTMFPWSRRMGDAEAGGGVGEPGVTVAASAQTGCRCVGASFAESHAGADTGPFTTDAVNRWSPR